MATQGQWLGKWPGEWYGSLATNPNLIAAQLSGSGSITASLTFVSTATTAALSGGGTLTAQLSFTAPVVEAPKYYAGPSEKEKALMRQRLEEDEVLLAIIQMFVMEEA